MAPSGVWRQNETQPFPKTIAAATTLVGTQHAGDLLTQFLSYKKYGLKIMFCQI
jgi:hypothetical protein